MPDAMRERQGRHSALSAPHAFFCEPHSSRLHIDSISTTSTSSRMPQKSRRGLNTLPSAGGPARSSAAACGWSRPKAAATAAASISWPADHVTSAGGSLLARRPRHLGGRLLAAQLQLAALRDAGVVLVLRELVGLDLPVELAQHVRH